MATALSGSVLGGCAADDSAAPVEPAEPAMGADPMAEAVELDLEQVAPGMRSTYPFELPSLPFATDAVDAVVDQRTMEIHHGKHHQGYTDKLNAALEQHVDLQGATILQMLSDLEGLPAEVQTAVRNSGGGYFNHALFWPLLAPGGAATPEGDLATAIDGAFGSTASFRDEFSAAASGVFGSGWAWLCADSAGSLQIAQCANQDTPLERGLKPILGIDVWEHAYYLKYQNRRGDYIANFLDAVNWTQAATNFTA